MICKQLLGFLLLAVALSACNSGNPKKVKTKAIPEAQKQETVHSEKKPDGSEDLKDTTNTENVFRRYDAVKKILKNGIRQLASTVRQILKICMQMK